MHAPRIQTAAAGKKRQLHCVHAVALDSLHVQGQLTITVSYRAGGTASLYRQIIGSLELQ